MADGRPLAFARTQRLPLVATLGNRDLTTNRDSRLVNCYAERDPEREGFWIEKRVGLLTQSHFAGAGNGVYNWAGNVYSVYGGTLYKNGTSLGAVDSSNGVYRFVQIRGSPGRLVLGNGVKAYWTDGTVLTQITDPNFPAAFVKGWAYLDGTLYVMDQQANIWGSQNLDDPTVWNGLNFIIARIEPDLGVALAKQLVYVIALKQWTTEVFYDAANAAPGSPLGPVQGAKAPYGCVNADSVQEIDDTLYWLAANRQTSPQIVRMANLQVTPVSSPQVERLLGTSNLSQVYSWVLKRGGHSFYGITLLTSNTTLVYNITENLWDQYTDVNENFWPISSMSFDGSYNHIAQHVSAGNLYQVDSDFVYPNDDGVVVPVDIYTPNETFGQDRRKMLSMMRFNADQYNGSVLQVRVSDDDYQSWSNFRTVDLSRKRPILTNCGTFYRRAWNFRHASNTPLRIRSVDLQMELGTL